MVLPIVEERPTCAILCPRATSYFGARHALRSALKFGELEPYGPRNFPCRALPLPRLESFTIVSIAQLCRRARMQRTATQPPPGASIVDRRGTGAWCSNGAVPAARDATRKRRTPPSPRAFYRSDHAAHETETEHAEHHRGDALHVTRVDHAAEAIA